MRAGSGEANGGSFAVDMQGGAARQVVVLLHSSASSSSQWFRLGERLGAKYVVRAVDLHGHGAQPAWRGETPLALADEVALLEPLLREGGGVHLVGHSYGAAIALKAVLLHPWAVRSVVVYEPVLFRWLQEEEPRSRATREVADLVAAMRHSQHRGDECGAAERFVDYWSGTGSWERLPRERQLAFAARVPVVLDHFAALFRERLAAPAATSLPPVLFLSGAQSPLSMQRIAAIARGRMPSATFEKLPNMGHMGPITNGDVVNARIERFLESCAEDGDRPGEAAMLDRAEPGCDVPGSPVAVGAGARASGSAVADHRA